MDSSTCPNLDKADGHPEADEAGMVFGSHGCRYEGPSGRFAAGRICGRPLRGIGGQLTPDRPAPVSCSKVRIWLSVSA